MTARLWRRCGPIRSGCGLVGRFAGKLGGGVGRIARIAAVAHRRRDRRDADLAEAGVELRALAALLGCRSLGVHHPLLDPLLGLVCAGACRGISWALVSSPSAAGNGQNLCNSTGIWQ